jgi:predicted enzyme related to lactoylglutathione lyase
MTGSRIVEITLDVASVEESIAFYEQVFQVTLDRDEHGDGPVHYHVQFGTWPSEQFFLLHVFRRDGSQPRPSHLGFLVDDLGAVHGRALAAGATELAAPHHVPGMPQNSCVEDPSGNTIDLYQG